MIISRASSADAARTKRGNARAGVLRGLKLALAAAAVLAVMVTGCTAAPPPDTALPPALPTFQAPGAADTPAASTESPRPTEAPTAEATASADAFTIWLEQPFGPDGLLAVAFFAEATGQSCVRYMVSVPGARPVEACAEDAHQTLVAVQGHETDSAGATYTVVAGRVLADAVTVVSVELESGESLPVPVAEHGFVLIVPGRQTAWQAVPINAFGNLVGAIFRFPRGVE